MQEESTDNVFIEDFYDEHYEQKPEQQLQTEEDD